VNILDIAVIVVVVLGSASIVFSVLAVLSHVLSDRREERILRLRSGMLRELDAFLAGDAERDHVFDELRNDRGTALDALVLRSSTLSRDQRQRLLVFFEYFQFVQRASKALRDRQWSRRASAATHLGFMGTRDVIPDLLGALESSMLDVRLASGYALAHMGAPEAVVPILRAFAVAGTWPSERTAEMLYELGSEAVEPLLAFLRGVGMRSTDPSVSVALKVLGMLRARAGVPLMIDFLQQPIVEVRVNSAKALGLIDDKQAVTALCDACSDPEWQVRSAAAQALGRLQDPISIPVLQRGLSDSNWWVRFNSAESLYQIGRDGIQALKATLTAQVDTFACDISRQILQEHGPMDVLRA
jgi:hypothetical protein